MLEGTDKRHHARPPMLNIDTAHLRLRPARPGDENFLKSLYASTRDDLRAAPMFEILLEMQWRAQRAGYRQDFPAADDTIVEVDGAPLGRLLVERSLQPWRIVDLALLPAARGRGIGAAVLAALQERAGAAGAALELTVRHDNARARRLYLAAGFLPAGADEMAERMVWPG